MYVCYVTIDVYVYLNPKPLKSSTPSCKILEFNTQHLKVLILCYVLVRRKTYGNLDLNDSCDFKVGVWGLDSDGSWLGQA